MLLENFKIQAQVILHKDVPYGERGANLARSLGTNPAQRELNTARDMIVKTPEIAACREGVMGSFWSHLLRNEWNDYTGYPSDFLKACIEDIRQFPEMAVQEDILYRVPSCSHGIAVQAIHSADVAALESAFCLRPSP